MFMPPRFYNKSFSTTAQKLFVAVFQPHFLANFSLRVKNAVFMFLLIACKQKAFRNLNIKEYVKPSSATFLNNYCILWFHGKIQFSDRLFNI